MNIVEKSIQMIKEKEFIDYKKWNHYAKEHDLLTFQTLRRLTSKSYKELKKG